MMLALFIFGLVGGLCVAHAVGRLLHRKPGPQANPVRRVVERRQVAAEDAYASLFEFDEKFTGWKVQRYTPEEYRRRRNAT